MFKLASWNVNSLKVRLEQVLAWINTSSVDVLALQETKTTDDAFPYQAFADLGLHVTFSGQKTYNGVALISRTPLENVLTDLPHFVDPQRRILVATVNTIRIVNLYVPNGAAVDSEKYNYKLHWLQHVIHFLEQELKKHPNLVVMGDFNIAPEDRDVYDPQAFDGDILVSKDERDAFQRILSLGLTDGFRHLHPEVTAYSWWDYRGGNFRQNKGARIDHILLSDPLLVHGQESEIDRAPRRQERPSDHAPIWVTVDI